jgi:formate-dependent nitrite reductase membrane component NrfD
VVVDALPVGRRPPRSDLLVIAGFIRPWVLWRGLFVGRPFLSHWSSAVMITVSGLMVEPLAWLQSLLLRRQLRAGQLPPDPHRGDRSLAEWHHLSASAARQ